MIKKIPILFFLISSTLTFLSAQSTAIKVYEIFQNKCVSCHDHDSPQNGLDLEGTGATTAAKALNVYNKIFNVTPENSFAAGKGYKYVYPGRTDRSFLFRKINNDLEPTIHPESGEEQAMPPYGEPQLTNEEKELIRQWILFGAPTVSNVVDEQLIYDYYNVNGQASFPNGPPEAPAEGEGFQIKMGPFFLNPSGQAGDELEYFTKYELDLPSNMDITRLDIKISPSSHHFIIYDFDSPFYASQVSHGLRQFPNHSAIGLVAAVQEAQDIRLPEGTAFIWENDLVLDLNSHYINYSASNTLMAEAYVNVYTQPGGTAAQEMKTDLLVNDNIYINNNGNQDIETQVVNYNLGEVFLWGLMGHTHQWGTGYKVYKRENGSQGELIYDASCAQGVPGCVAPYFDYQHIPMRYFWPLEPLTFNFSNGIIHEATYENNGPSPVWFGPTSDDEMMVLIVMYTEDTLGIVTSNEEIYNPLDEVMLFPNPANDKTTLVIPANTGIMEFRLYDMLGREVRNMPEIAGKTIEIERGNLNSGMYVYRLEEDSGRVKTGKLVFE